MANREVIVTRTGRYGTRMLTAGDTLTVSGPEARALIALKRAKEAPEPTRGTTAGIAAGGRQYRCADARPTCAKAGRARHPDRG